MQVLVAASTGLSAYSAYQAVDAGQGQTINGKDNQIPTGKTGADGKPETRDATATDKVGGINVSISIGSSKSESRSESLADTASGSQIRAGGSINLVATGAGQDSNILIQGSELQAARDIVLVADNRIQLQASQDVRQQHSSNSGSSGSLGVSFGSSGLAVNASVSKSSGHGDGDGVSYNNTRLNAGESISLDSGGDTTLQGAVVAGKQVTADIGGTLTIESLQDTDYYNSKQQSAGASLSVGIGSGALSGSLNYGKSKIDSDFVSVNERSGLLAGDDGFNVTVKGDTTLTGGVIASTGQAVQDQKNRFRTDGQLSISDLQNHAGYEASSVSVNLGAGFSPQGAWTPSGSGAGIGNDSGSAESTTLSGISGIAGNQDVRTGDAETGLKPIFDAGKVQKEIDAQALITQTFGQLSGEAVSRYAQEKRQELYKQLNDTTSSEEKAALQEAIKDINLQERVMNVLIGAVGGMGTSALTKETLSAAADEMRQLMIADSAKFAGIVDGDKVYTNLTGESEGVRQSGQKLGGTRWDLDKACGESNERCAKNPDDSLLRDDQRRVQWTGKMPDGSPQSFEDFLKTEKGKELSGTTGGIQGMPGTLWDTPYAPGSWQDKLIEAFAGTHDFIGGKLSGLYDAEGNATRGRSDELAKIQDIWSATGAIAVSTPFAMSEVFSPAVWNAISVLLKAR
ncbi:hemagglutinin repeat-containing protein [Laribacter hongkongensis]|uniref:hemagglutinin repeat-containing protein n=1 Tax=Laribacter hongkongensis TaxID=168471 RepID=UPI001EFDB016|nr:hemagglutinin repeat-containing protein [Laribacter hongkongensis]MCG9060158.1 hemagglutinin repeat-containing protein [Laribacter hongkongensis]MCG9087255.1 hemagglutinin repeat-containing protein [Laribacter hongkongensis]